MKILIIGGGGVRTTQFIQAIVRRADFPPVEEICLMDIDPVRLEIMSAICRSIAGEGHQRLRITTATDAQTAFEGANYIVTTIRVGGDEGRILDERIALRNGVLGQETTGAGGFAMAMRSIPAILHYAQTLRRVCPEAWMFNFTNPAGLVTQALHDSGFERVVGICDSANNAQHALAKFLAVPARQLRAELFGLNHLSWTRHVWFEGRDVLPEFLADEHALAASIMNMFDHELVQALGMYLNEYLFYYYYSDRAMKAILNDSRTRGEEVKEINDRLWQKLREVDISRNPRAGLDLITGATQRRESTYMHYARQGSAPQTEGGEGYAGVVLDVITALETDRPLTTGLNVPNRDAIDCMRSGDVVEASCRVDGKGVHILPVGAVPEAQELMMRSVKRYERLAVEAILKRDRQTAVMALMAHPLVMSYPLAQTLVNEYLAAHAPYVGEWT